jgi:LysM repeat protein
LSGSKFQGPNPATHKVLAGETAWDIARYYDVSLKELLRTNNLSRKGRIRSGDILTIPSRSTTPTPAAVVQKDEVAGEFDYYVVRSGDNLSGISKKLNISVSVLKSINGIRNQNRIKIGQRLKFKSTAKNAGKSAAIIESEKQDNQANAKIYVVKRGDTLWDIAHDHKTSIREIKKINGMGSGSKIKPGQQLILPPG